jgi:hypothetical protein
MLRCKIGAIHNGTVDSGDLAGERADSRLPAAPPRLAGRELTLGKPATIDTNRSAICRLFHQRSTAV